MARCSRYSFELRPLKWNRTIQELVRNQCTKKATHFYRVTYSSLLAHRVSHKSDDVIGLCRGCAEGANTVEYWNPPRMVQEPDSQISNIYYNVSHIVSKAQRGPVSSVEQIVGDGVPGQIHGR